MGMEADSLFPEQGKYHKETKQLHASLEKVLRSALCSLVMFPCCGHSPLHKHVCGRLKYHLSPTLITALVLKTGKTPTHPFAGALVFYISTGWAVHMQLQLWNYLKN